MKAGVAPSDAIVVENAPLGVRAGKAAGCFTVAVMTGPIPMEEFSKEGADMIFPSMDHFADWLEREYSQAGSEPQESATAELCKRIDEAVEALNPATVTVVTDSNVSRLIMPLLAGCRSLAKANTVVIEPGEDNKDINSAIKIWNALEETEATRKSIVVNIGADSSRI